MTIVSRELAIRTLQLEMEWAFECLESEAMDILGGDIVASDSNKSKQKGVADLTLSSRGSTDVIALLCAEYNIHSCDNTHLC